MKLFPFPLTKYDNLPGPGAAVLFCAAVLLFASCGVAAQTGPKCTVPPANLVSWWTGDGTTSDLKGANHGALLNGATYAAGKVGQAFSFDGANSVVRVESSPSLLFGTGEVTFTAWIQALPGSTFRTIIGKGGTEYPYPGHSLRIADDNKPEFGISDCGTGACGFSYPGGGGSRQTVRAVSVVTDGYFHHVAGLRRADGTLEIYVDGVLESTRIQPPFNSDHNVALGIGALIPIGWDHQPFNGLVDEVHVFNRALSAAEIAALYGAGSAGACKLQVVIDIRPGNDQNTINKSSAGVIPVAILSTPLFDATSLSPATIDLAGAGVKLVGKDERPLCRAHDVNTDGLADLVCDVYAWQFLVSEGTDKAILRAQTSSGLWVWGEDSIRIVPD